MAYTPFNTGNPIGTWGSVDPRDLVDNAAIIDRWVNDRTITQWRDRFGVQRLTWNGMEVSFQQAQDDRQDAFDAEQAEHQADFDAAQAQRESDFNAFLLSSGYQFIGDYDTDGPLTITQVNQIFSKDGEFWRAGAALMLPYTTVNDWATDEANFVSVGDAALRQELAEDDGANKVGWSRHSLSSAVVNVHQALDAQPVSAWEFAGLIADKPTADPATWDWSPAIQAALDSGAPVVTVPSCRVASQLLINDGQTIYLDGDILVDWYAPLGPTARVRDVMQASLFANKRGLATALAFIGDGTFSAAINASGKFLPNQNHNATDNGERGIKIIQRVGRIYSNRARYTPDTGPYAAVVLCITEQCDIQLSRVENMGAGMFAYHALSNRVMLNGKNIGTDYRGTTPTTDLLAGSYGCVYLGKALNWDNEIHAIGQNCNDVLTLDGICRGNELISASWEDSTDPGARNNRVLELSDNCRGNDGRVTACGGGRYEHVVMQDDCSSNAITLLSQDSAGRCVTIKRNCFSNSVVVNARNWATEATSVGAVELVQSNSRPGCGGNAFDLQLFHPTGGRKAIVELLTDSNLPHLNNDYRVKLGYGSGAVTYTFTSPDGMLQNGSLLEGAATESVSIMGQSSAMAAASTYLIAPLGQSGLTSIRPAWDCQVRGLRVSGNGTFTAGSIQVFIEVFRGGIWVSLDEIAMTPTGQDALREYRDRFACYCNVPLESLRVRAVTSADFVGTGFTLLYALSLSRTL
ncbi:hypothetical protein P3W55_13495 [Pseudomonas citronellolis]|uniref:Pectate lyase superfamily protein n=1 Tax=Pseudomonas citronellolis TaxID=53408 RepID=A0AAW6P7S5_9PSED|nr:hypothetical protein [Pseudomonas citronellolis]MDF3842725.1 hypothetical protein [Pseudomonas citronellolis]